jgi:hypothetical protein
MHASTPARTWYSAIMRTVPKAIEMYKGKAIFYSLSNFCMTKPFPSASWQEEPWAHGALRNHADQDPEYPLLPYGRDAKRTLLAKRYSARQGVKSVSFVPMMIDKLYRPEVLRNGDPRFDDMVRYMEVGIDGIRPSVQCGRRRGHGLRMKVLPPAIAVESVLNQ